MNLSHPLRFDRRGRTASATPAEHVRQLIELVLFTGPEERVNRPDFGSGLQQAVFAGNGALLAEAVQLMVKGALQQWLAELIDVGTVEVRSEDATLEVVVTYRVRPNGDPVTTSFSRSFG